MERKLDLIINLIKEQGISLNSRIDGVEERLNSKIDGVEENLNSKIDNLRKEMNENNNSLRKEMNENNDSLRKEMNENNDSLRKDINRIETKLDSLSNQVTVLEAYAHDKCEAALDGWATHLEKQEDIGNNVTNLNSKTENHEIRISVLEDVLEY